MNPEKMMKDIFEKTVTDEVIGRIDNLDSTKAPLWGSMNASQMLAHCSVTYELVYDNKPPKPKGVKKLLLKWFVKGIVTNEKPYKKGSPTAPEFKIVDKKEFGTEKQRLVNYLTKTQELGKAHFDGKESHSFGKLTATEWNNMFYKHLDHHLTQFGV